MKRFTQLYTELDQTNRTNEKVAALESYFREAAPADAAWALHFLCGRKVPRAVTSTALREWAAAESALPAWLLDECYETVGDLAETIALILPDTVGGLTLPLHQMVAERLLDLESLPLPARRKLLAQTWRELNAAERFVWNKLLTGSFRVGVAQTLVERALASVAGVAQSAMAHRLMGLWKPREEDFLRLLSGAENDAGEIAKPFPFFLASPTQDPTALGAISDWQVEWKWDGIRAQIIRRQGEALIWSRGDEMITGSFPEIAAAATALPDGTVLDGEILAWTDAKPQPFGRLQLRLGRKSPSTKLQRDLPVVFVAYDVLEFAGEDWRARALSERRSKLETAIAAAAAAPRAANEEDAQRDLFERLEPATQRDFPLRISEILHPVSWEELSHRRMESRARAVEGVMLKRLTSSYGTGRQRGDWWKWKIEPLTMDAVLIGAQAGHGRRANLYTDYTFGVWHGGALVPVAKAYSGLTDEEILEVDKFVRGHTTGKFGPVRAVEAELVFELAFEGINESPRHKSGIAVRFPRIKRRRDDKKPEDADTLESLRALLLQNNRG